MRSIASSPRHLLFDQRIPNRESDRFLAISEVNGMGIGAFFCIVLRMGFLEQGARKGGRPDEK